MRRIELCHTRLTISSAAECADFSEQDIYTRHKGYFAPANSRRADFFTFILQCIETILELLTKPERRIVDDLMGVALADVKGNNLAVLGIAVDEGDVVEKTADLKGRNCEY